MPKHMQEVQKAQIIKRVALVLLSLVVFIYAFFFMPLPNDMKRPFGKNDCISKGGQWDEGNARCKQLFKDK